MNPETGTGPASIEALVPAVFFLDHDKRGCVQQSGEPVLDPNRRWVRPYVLGTKGTKLRVVLHPDDMYDLASDAYHYASSGPAVYEGMIGLCTSARSTLLDLFDQGLIQTGRDRWLDVYVERLVQQRARRRLNTGRRR
jgi:hypothetical protein